MEIPSNSNMLESADMATTPSHPQLELTGSSILYAVRRFGGRVLVVVLASVGVGAAITLYMEPSYQSRAVLLVKFGRDQVYRPALGANAPSVMPSLPDLDGMINTQVQMLTSRDVIVPVIQSIGLKRLYPELAEKPHAAAADADPKDARLPAQMWRTVVAWFAGVKSQLDALRDRGTDMDKAVRRFEDNLSVARFRASDLVHVEYANHDPALAQTALRELFSQERRLSSMVHNGAGERFYDVAIDQSRLRLNQAQQAIAAFRTANGVLSFREQMPILLKQRSNLDVLRRQTALELLAGFMREKTLMQQKAALPPDVVAFSDTVTGQHYQGTVRHSRNSVLTEVEGDIQRTQAETASLIGRQNESSRQIKDVDDAIQKASSLEAQRISLENNVQTEEDNIRNLQVRREEAKLLSNLDEQEAAEVSFVQAPTLSDKSDPIRPAPVRYMTISLIVGLLSGVTLAMVSAFQNASTPLRDKGLGRSNRRSLLPQQEIEPDMATESAARDLVERRNG